MAINRAVLSLVVGLGLLSAQPSAQDQDQTGDLEVTIEDYPTGSRIVYGLQTGSERLALQFDDDGPDLRHGTRVRVHGRRVGQTLALNKRDVQALSFPQVEAIGEVRALVILFNFNSDQRVHTDWASAYNLTFGTVNDFYREASYGRVGFTGDVAGFVTIAASPSSCDYNTFASQADQKAQQVGFNPANYSRVIYAFPSIGACGWWGLGQIGGSRTWVNGSYTLHVVGHEQGHNFGLQHSRSQPCESGGCGLSEYGDDADIMGNLSPGHFNAYQKERLGWLQPQDVTASGVYQLDPYEVASQYPQSLKVAGFYVEARTAAGFGAYTAPGVILHAPYGDSSVQVDLTPASSDYDSRLDVNQVFSSRGFSIRTLSSGEGGAVVDITVQEAPPPPPPPPPPQPPSGCTPRGKSGKCK